MKRTVFRVLALAALALLTLVLPACYDGYGEEPDVYMGVAVYGGYWAPGYVGGCCYGPVGGVGMSPPIGYGGPQVVHY